MAQPGIRRKGLRGAFRWWRGWGEDPLGELKLSPGRLPKAHPADSPSQVAAASVLGRLLDMSKAGDSGSAPAPVAARLWWSDQNESEFAPDDPEGKELWTELLQNGRRFERLSWCAWSCSDEISCLLFEAVARFQLHETILGDDHFPLPLGVFSFQAAAAACLVAFLEFAASTQALANQITGHVDEVREWLKDAPGRVPLKSGDLVLFHLLGRGLSNTAAGIADLVRAHERRVKSAYDEVESARRRQAMAHNRQERREARTHVKSAREFELQQQNILTQLKSISVSAESLLRQWLSRDPWSASTEDQNFYWLDNVLATGQTEGLAAWALRRLAAGCRLGIAPSQWCASAYGFLADCLTMLADTEHADSRFPAAQAVRFYRAIQAVRFYALWAYQNQHLSDTIAPPSNSEQPYYVRFFAPLGYIFGLPMELSVTPGNLWSEKERSFHQQFVRHRETLERVRIVSSRLTNVIAGLEIHEAGAGGE